MPNVQEDLLNGAMDLDMLDMSPKSAGWVDKAPWQIDSDAQNPGKVCKDGNNKPKNIDSEGPRSLSEG